MKQGNNKYLLRLSNVAMGQHPGGEFANSCYSLVPPGPSLVDHESASAALALG